MQRVLFLTTAHHPKDDRIFFHQAQSLAEAQFTVKITSLCANLVEKINSIEIESYSILEKSTSEKIETFLKVCRNFLPETIICSEPLAIFAAKKYKKEHKTTIIYDVTEWYPSMSMLRDFSFPSKIFQGLKFSLINLYGGLLSDRFIFGEETKKFPLAYFFPFKKKMILPYYPDSKFIFNQTNTIENNSITLCYTGQISEEKGIGNFFKAADFAQKSKQEYQIKLLIIGSARTKEDEIYFENLLQTYHFNTIEIKQPSSFETFTENFREADICFDLRELNFENHHSLPIKLFYYIGAGKPIVYSNLKGIRQHMNVSEFGDLVNPKNEKQIAEIILNYIENPEKYIQHSQNATKAFATKYNWNIIKNSFINFIKK